MTKQVIIIRKDLPWTKGKMCAQAAHASMKVFFDRGIFNCNKQCFEIQITESWIKGDFTKIVVGVNSLEELKELHYTALTKQIPTAMIVDNGKTIFKGVPTETAIAIDQKRQGI